MSYPMIGRRVGGRDHSTVLYGLNRVESRIARDRGFAAHCQSVIDRILTHDPVRPDPALSAEEVEALGGINDVPLQRDPKAERDAAVVAAIQADIDAVEDAMMMRWLRSSGELRGQGAQDTLLPNREIPARREAARAAQIEREAQWLEREKVRYGLPARGTPLSGMPA